MGTKHFILLPVLLFICICVQGQNSKSCIINIERNQVYIDLTNSEVKVGDKLAVYVSGGYITNPTTGRRVRKENMEIATMEVGETYSNYSIARLFDVQLIGKLKVGMGVKLIGNTTSPSSSESAIRTIETSSKVEQNTSSISLNTQVSEPLSSDRIPVVVASAEVNDVVNNGHFGGYVADILMEQLLMCDKVRLLDRSVLNAQINEIDLSGDIVDSKTAIQKGKVIGARYIIQTTMQKPDVANIRTGIPLAAAMGAVEIIAGRNIGASLASNIQVATLKASVGLSVRVVDLQTGEVVFMASSTGKAQGKSQLSLEYGALGGGELNGGAEGFKQTVTGKAIQQAFLRVGANLKAFFSGTTDRKVMGSVVNGGVRPGERMSARGYSLYIGTEKLDMDGARIAFGDNANLYFQYRKAKKQKTWFWVSAIGGLGIGAGVAALGMDDLAFQYVGCGVAAVGIVGAILINSSARKKIKNIASLYNNTISSYEKLQNDSPRLSLAMSGQGLGVRLTF